MDFLSLNIQKLVFHQIGQKPVSDEDPTIILSENLSVLEYPAKETFQKRVVTALGKNSRRLQMEISQHTKFSAFSIFKSMLNCSDKEFIKLSKDSTIMLSRAQNSSNIPGGVVLVFSGTIGDKSLPCVGIIKAEIEEGFTIDNSNHAAKLKFIDDLILTPQQRLYKIGLFVLNDPTQIFDVKPTDLSCYIFDTNISNSNQDSAAIYFYKTFLGLNKLSTAQTQTDDFYKAVHEWVNKTINDPYHAVEIISALDLYLLTEKTNVISANEFSDRYLTEDEDETFSAFMTTIGLSTGAISKDISSIKKTLTSTPLIFSNGVNFIIKTDDFKNSVKIEKGDNSTTTITVLGKLIKK